MVILWFFCIFIFSLLKKTVSTQGRLRKKTGASLFTINQTAATV